MNDWYQKSKEKIFSELNTSENGITKEEAEHRLKKYGKNIIEEKRNFLPVKIFFQQFQSFLIYILIFAALISFLIDHLIDGIAISSIILINASIGFFQQYKAERAIQNLKKLIVKKSKVIRDGKMMELDSSLLVPGDILVVEAGNKINADCRIIESENLQVEEAILTGESLPTDKISQDIREKRILAEHQNMLFAGTKIVNGSGKAIVVSTGMNTQFGKIAGSLQQIPLQKTPIQKSLDEFSKQLGFVILGMVALVMVIGVWKNFDKLDIFMTAVALLVSSIPEGLPAVLVMSFGISSYFMSKKNVIIRRLPAVEGLGSVTVICSDKTGTMTEEKMQIVKLFANNKYYLKQGKNVTQGNKNIQLKNENEFSQLLKTSVLCNNARFEVTGKSYTFLGDPTEQALLSAALDLGFNKKTMIEAEPSIKKFEFDSRKKMMSVIRTDGRKTVMYSKGAPEKIIEHCSFELINNQVRKLSQNRKNELLDYSKSMEKEALRVLAFAFRNLQSNKDFDETGLTFLGFEGMIDPPRKGVREAILKCRAAGIEVKMITGDSLHTALSISKQVGIVGKALTGKELDALNDDEFEKRLDDVSIFARTSPEQKLRITQILQKKGEIVAVTGDGINDSLALKSADVGVAMGIRGTDVSREVSDIILADDNFVSLVDGVEEGRKTYDNIKKFIKYVLTVNFSQIFLIAATIVLKMPLPMLPLQILWANIITDSVPAIALVFERKEDVMKSKPKKEKSILEGLWGFIILGGMLSFLACFIVYFIGINKEISIERIRTMVLAIVIIFELSFIYTCRSNKPLTEIGFFSNKFLNYAVLFSLALQFLLMYTGISVIFGVVPLTIKEWMFVIPFALSGLIIFEIRKYFRKK